MEIKLPVTRKRMVLTEPGGAEYYLELRSMGRGLVISERSEYHPRLEFMVTADEFNSVESGQKIRLTSQLESE